MISTRKLLLLLFGLLACSPGSIWAATGPSTPVLTVIVPRGMQRGTEKVVTFSGARLFDAKEVLLYDEGLEVKKIEQVDNNNVKVTLWAAADCRLGEHVAQLRTASGVSDYRNFFVGAMEEIDEAEPNSEFDAAQKIELNRTVNGVILAEDRDFFRITAKRGQRISVEVEAIRLGVMFDPVIAIYDDQGNELQAVDDCAQLKQDAMLSIAAPSDGEYVVLLREASYGGNENCRYRLHVGDFPRVSMVFPLGGKPGEKRELTFFGDPSGEIKKEVTLPESVGDRRGIFFSDDAGITPSPLRFMISDIESKFEVEPNGDMDQKDAFTLPVAIDGRIAEGDKLDYHLFSAKQGQVVLIDCHARALGSPLDPTVNIFYANRKHITGQDDFKAKPDTKMRFTVPADGDYYVRVFDKLFRSGEDFTYRLNMELAKPKLSVAIRRTDRYSQRRQQVVIPQGNRFGMILEAKRENFAGELKLIADALPVGVEMHFRPMAASINYMPVVFSATDQSPVGGGLFDLEAAHIDDKRRISGGYRLRAELVTGPPNNSLYYPCFTEKIPIAVVDSVPFKLEMVQPKAPLLRNGNMKIKIIAHRDEGFDQDIWLRFPFRPPGVGTSHQIKLPKGKSEINYPLNANDKAQIGKWPMYVIGQAENKGRAWVSTELKELEVAEPRVAMQLQRTSLTRGESAEMQCTIEQLIAFEGEATAELLGVPPHVITNSPLKFTKDSTSLAFKFETSEKSPHGKHGPFVRVTIPHGEEKMVANVGWGELIINKPKAKKKNAKKVATK